MKIESDATSQVLSSLLESLREQCQTKPVLPGFDVVVDLVVLVSSADGQIDETEQSALQKTIQALSGGRLNEAQLAEEISACVENLRAKGPEEQAKRLGNALATLEAEEQGLRLGVAIAVMSRGVSVEEHSVLVHVADAAGVSFAQLSSWSKEMKQLLG
jgi:tellurite resistance protein